MRNTALACLFTALATCAARPQSLTLVDRPVTIRIAVSSATRQAENIALQLEQVTTPKSGPATWNMFVELPAADSGTSVDLPNFAGYVTAMANLSAPANPPKSMTLQIPDSAAAIVRRLSQVRLTFVPAGKLPDPGVRIGAVRLEPLP